MKRWTNRARGAAGLMAAMLVAAGGCVGEPAGQREAFDRWDAVDERTYGGTHGRAYERGDAGGGVGADVELGASPRLADYIAYAQANNPELRAAFERWHAALQAVDQAGALPDPQLSYAYFVRESMTQQTAALAQTFPWWGRLREQSGAALERARAAEQEFEAARLEVIEQVKQAHAEYAYLRQALEVKAEHVRVLERMAQAAESGFEAGDRPWADVVQAELAVEELSDARQSVAARREPVEAQLNAALGRDPSAELDWPEPVEVAAVELEEAELLELQLRRNPELAGQRHVVAGRRGELGAARQNRVPDVTVGVEYMDMVPTGMRDQVAVMGSINLPIWSGRLEAERAEALAAFGAASHEQTALEQQLAAELRVSWARYRDTQRRAGLFERRLIPMARQSLRANEDAYGQGEVGFQAVAEAQASLQQLELAHRRVQAELVQQQASIERLVGGEIARDQADESNQE